MEYVRWLMGIRIQIYRVYMGGMEKNMEATV